MLKRQSWPFRPPAVLSVLPPHEKVFRAVFRRRLFFKSLNTLEREHVDTWTRPEKKHWGPPGLNVFFRALYGQGLTALLSLEPKSGVWEMFPRPHKHDIWPLGGWLSEYQPPGTLGNTFAGWKKRPSENDLKIRRPYGARTYHFRHPVWYVY